MDNLNLQNRKGEKGFTLVELAVVMIIIGLLIGGILKGQELITNARVTSSASQVEAMGAAYNSFRDQYNAIPGDMATAQARIGTCGNQVAACNDGDGDGRIGVNVGAAGALAANSAAGEPGNFYGQLLASGLITSMDGTAVLSFGNQFPTAPIGGGFLVGDTRTGVTEFLAADMRPGIYVVLNGVTGAVADGDGALNPQQAANIDRRLDDGLASAGTVIGQDTAANCKAAAGDDEYDSVATQTCAIAYRM
ncbi:MAG: prepilin-type N-terminal cleavage/methylation domain-containing protein [Alphaproteobacteria bacterium]|nr:prepilin-type N-terminal cleavage/methylation domain-containing protein [Alphaproteobacteria bacterium]